MHPFKWACVLIAVGGLCGTTPRAAYAAQRGPDRSVRPAADHSSPAFMAPPARKDPFKRLFPGIVTPPSSSSSPLIEAQLEPKLVCGTLLIPGNARVDPKIRAEAPKTSTKFTMRGIQPRVCWPQ